MEAVNLISSSKYSEKQIVRLMNNFIGYIIDRAHVGLPCCYSANARELGFPSIGCQLHSEGLG